MQFFQLLIASHVCLTIFSRDGFVHSHHLLQIRPLLEHAGQAEPRFQILTKAPLIWALSLLLLHVSPRGRLYWHLPVTAYQTCILSTSKFIVSAFLSLRLTHKGQVPVEFDARQALKWILASSTGSFMRKQVKCCFLFVGAQYRCFGQGDPLV